MGLVYLKTVAFEINEDIMKIKKYSYLVSLLFLCLMNRAFSQPYFYTGGTDTTQFFRINLQNCVKDVFYSDRINPWGNITWDPTQHWIFIQTDNSYQESDEYYLYLAAVNATTTTIIHKFPDQIAHPLGTSPHTFYDGFVNNKAVYDGIVYNPSKNVFYVSWCLPYPDTLENWDDLSQYQRTAVYDASSFTVLDTLAVPPGWITSATTISDDGNFLYLEKWEGDKPIALGKYSLVTKQLILNRDLSTIITQGVQKDIHDNKKGKCLLFFAYPKPQPSDMKYGLYNIDTDTALIIPFPMPSHGSVSSNGKYILIEETPLKSDYLEVAKTSSDIFLHPGRISIFNGISGKLLQHIKIPPDGKVLVFDNYPGMIYCYFEKKNKSINIDLTKLVTIATINSQNILTGSGEFTLIVKGTNFTVDSKVSFTGDNRATTFIADTLLQATIRSGDVDASTTAYIAVKDGDATTDSLAMNIVSVPPQSLNPILDCITQQNDTTYTAWFGYENTNSTSITVPIGPQNKFTPTPNDRTQPTVFDPGRKDKIFSVVFNGKNLTWKLNGNEVVASKKSPKCN